MRSNIASALAGCSLALVAFALGVPQAGASSSSGKVKISNCTKALTRPRTVTLTCGDGTIALEKLSWSSFGGARANASGKISVNSCEPNCAASRPRSYPVRIVASKPRSCKGKVSVYGSVSITFTGAKPKSASSLKRVALECPM